MNEIKEDAYQKIYETDGIKTQAYGNLPGEQLAMINNLWEELKSDITVSPVIYTMCAVIVLTLVAFAVFFLVRKRVRASYYD